ncbi:MAG TPA: FAD:protein FMN transferase [Candidatus Angelobacter sp.]|jgi:thiamine biosynthesis lipoprotein|nr:FAD:protein FMN transferase [Candidatus Angelobacter sp.]
MDDAARLRPRAPRTLRVEHVMGTVVSIDVRDAEADPHVLDTVVEWLHEVDARFSTYREDSEVSRLSRGELSLGDAHADVREALALCDEVHALSHGLFDVWRGGRLDPSALVKGWSVERAALILQLAGLGDFCVNAGGDVLVRGEAAPGEPWRVGIRHPEESERVAAVLAMNRGAAATSGLYERGGHIVDPRTGQVASRLLSVTVVGPSLTYADAFSTAAFAMGADGVRWVAAELPGYDAYAITAEHRAVWTAGLDALLAPAES